MPPEQKAIPKGGNPDTYDARLTVLEQAREDDNAILLEIRDAVVGKGGLTPGLGEKVRFLEERVAFIYGLAKWAAGIGATAVIGLWGAWLNGGRPGSH